MEGLKFAADLQIIYIFASEKILHFSTERRWFPLICTEQSRMRELIQVRANEVHRYRANPDGAAGHALPKKKK